MAEYRERSGKLLEPATEDMLMMTPLPLEEGTALDRVTGHCPAGKGGGVTAPPLARVLLSKGWGRGHWHLALCHLPIFPAALGLSQAGEQLQVGLS